MARRTPSKSSEVGPPGGSPRDEVERLYLAGREGAALDLVAALVPERLSLETVAYLQHVWPDRLERMHPAALDDARRRRWESVARLGVRQPVPPDWSPASLVGVVDFPVLGRGGTSDRIVRLHVDVQAGRQDQLPGSKQITPTARKSIQSALSAARALLPQNVRFLVTLPEIGIKIDEESLGLPVAVAAISAALKWGISERFCLTGCVSDEGVVGAVSGLAQKGRLVAEERPLATLLVPVEVPTLTRAVARVFAGNLAQGRVHYRQLLRDEVRQQDLSRYRRVGLTTGDPEELRHLFVEPELLPDHSDQEWRSRERELARALEEPGLSQSEQESRRREYKAWVGRDFGRGSDGASERLTWAPIYETHRALIICGDLGMGKTTLLARLAFDGLGDSDAPNDEEHRSAPLPVLVSAADFSTKQDGSLVEFLKRAVQKRWADAQHDAIAALVAAFHDDNVALFIDGLNEAVEAERQQLLQRLAAWRVTRSRVRCVVTTRRSALATAMVPAGFRVFHLAGLSENQGYQMMARGKQQHSVDLWNTLHFIRSQPALREIAANPLMLMLTSRLSMDEIERLRHWVDVYERTMGLLLRGPRGAALPDLELRLHIRAWAAVADKLQRRSDLTLREYDARQILSEFVELSAAARERKLDELLAVALEHGGLLTRRGRHDLSFWHPSFQEYLAAVRWSESIPSDASVDSLLSAWRPLAERRDNHEALRLALGRMAFHLGAVQKQLAIDLLSHIANAPMADSLFDGTWLCLAADACLDGVPVSPQVRERLAIRLADRVRRFDDVPGTERLTRLTARLLTNDAPSAQACQSLARLLETPERISSDALTSTMRLLATAASRDQAAREACRRMYERVRPADGNPPTGFMGGWRASLLPIAALGLLRAGIVPDGLALRVLGPTDPFRASGDLARVVEAISTNPRAAEALRPFIQDENADVQASARCLYSIAHPLSDDAQDWMRQCVLKRDYSNPWLRSICPLHPEIPGRLFAMATAIDREAVLGVFELLLGVGTDAKMLVSHLVPWLLAQPFTMELAHAVPRRPLTTPQGQLDAFHREMLQRLAAVAASGTGPEAGRAVAWLAFLFAPPTAKAEREAWYNRLGKFASLVPPIEAKEWLSLFVRIEANALAGALAARLIRDAEPELLKPIIHIVNMQDLPRWWPPSVFAAVDARALEAANAGRAGEVLICAALTGDHRLDGVTRALEIVAASNSGLPSWEAAGWLLRLRRMNRELAIMMLRQLDRIDDDHFWREGYHLNHWIQNNCDDDEDVIREIIAALTRSSSVHLRTLNDTLMNAITTRPDRVNLLLESLRAADGAERKRACRLVSSVCCGDDEPKVSIRQIVASWIEDPDIGPAVVFALANAGAPLDARARDAMQTLAQRNDEQGKWASAQLAAWGEALPEHWSVIEARLASQNLDEVLGTAGTLLQAQRKPAALVENLRRCLRGSPVQALRAALILYGIEEPICDAVPKLLECLAIHDEQRFFETSWVKARRQRHGIHSGQEVIILSSSKQGEVVEKKASPQPTGRERFRPDFWFRESVAQCAASILAEMDCREVIPTLIEWLQGDQSDFALGLLRFLEAESEPSVRDFLIEKVRNGDYWESDSASDALFEADLAPERHIKTLLARLADEDEIKQRSASLRILILCATREVCARTAEEALSTLAPEDAWMVARWLIGVGRASHAIAAAYVDGEIKLPNLARFDRLTHGLGSSDKKQDWHALFDENRLYTDERVLHEFAARLREGKPAHRVMTASRVIAWLGESRFILDENPEPISLTGPLRGPLLDALRAGLGSDDIAVHSYAIDYLDRLGCFDDSVAAAAVSCLHEEFGEGPSRPVWGEPASKDLWEAEATWHRLDVARSLIRRGLKTEPIKMLTRFVERSEAEGSVSHDDLIKAVKLLMECSTEEVLVRQILARHVMAGRVRFYHFKELLPLLQRSDVSDSLIRAAVLDHFAHQDDFSAYLIRRWANGASVHSEPDAEQSLKAVVHREIRNEIPHHATALDVRTAHLKWLAAQNLPRELLHPAMVLLAVRYDEHRAERLGLALVKRRADATARVEVETLLATDESDGEGQRLAKAWLLASLTDSPLDQTPAEA